MTRHGFFRARSFYRNVVVAHAHQNSLFVALAHVRRASTEASTVAVLTENKQGSTASMKAATCGTPGGACPNASVGASVGV